RAVRPRGRAYRRGGVAVELLLLPGGAAEAGLSLLVLLAGSGRRHARARRALPLVQPDLREPRLARARRRAVPQRPRGGRRRARVRRRRARRDRGVPGRALVGELRRPPPAARIDRTHSGYVSV